MYKLGHLQFKLISELYFGEGMSAREIGEELGVGIQTVYRYMKRYGIETRNNAECNQVSFARKKFSYSVKKILTQEESELKLAGVMLYWAEGSKSDGSNTVDFANSDPRMIQLFINFLRAICGIDETKLRILLYCHGNQNVTSLLNFWSKIIQVPVDQFTKPYIRDVGKIVSKRVMKYGLVHIRYCDKKLLIQIKEWINEYSRNYISRNNGSVPEWSNGADCKQLQLHGETRG